MADSEALRQRRRRMHKAGDHSLCRRCPSARSGVILQPEVGLPPGFVPPSAALAPPAASQDLNPPAEMRALAARLAAAHEADPANSLIARELRMTLAELMPKRAENADADLTGLAAALQA